MARLTVPAGRRNYTVPDASGNGLLVYVSDNGSKLWKYRFNYAGRKNDVITIGEWPTLKYEEAKAKAAYFERVRTVEQRDPKLAVYRPNKATKINAVLDRYEGKMAERTRKTVKSAFKPVRAKFGENPIYDLTKPILKAWIEGHYAAKGNRAPRAGAARTMLKYLGAAINDAMNDPDEFEIPTGFKNPVVGLAPEIRLIREHQRGSHAVAWESEEITAIFAALRAAAESDRGFHKPGLLILELAMLTGARPSELQSAKWSDVERVANDPDLRFIVRDRHKTWKRTKRPRRITITAMGVRVLERARAWAAERGVVSDYIFPISRITRRSKVGYYNSLNTLARALSKDFLTFEIRPYHFRSGYINHTLAANEGNVSSEEWLAILEQVAENVGHTDVKITLDHYVRTKPSTVSKAAKLADAAFAKLAA